MIMMCGSTKKNKNYANSCITGAAGAKLAMIENTKKDDMMLQGGGACEPQKCAKGHLVQLRES